MKPTVGIVGGDGQIDDPYQRRQGGLEQFDRAFEKLRRAAPVDRQREVVCTPARAQLVITTLGGGAAQGTRSSAPPLGPTIRIRQPHG